VADDRANHGRHDPELIAALLDRDPSASERPAAEARMASCPDCAALHADLVALSQAAQALPRPARPRDFTLTAADAARLTAERVGEPDVRATRLTGVMTVRPDTAAHAAHDSVLVASLADRTLAPSERTTAQALVDTCDRCADLHADLVALAAATRAMPAPARAHDYTLTSDQAARLRGSAWRRFIGSFGSPRDALSRPLAVGLTTLGIAGLLLASLPSMSFGGASSASGPMVQPAASSEAGGPALSVAAPGATGSTTVAGDGSTTVPGALAPVAASAPPYRIEGTGQNQMPSPATVVAPDINASGKGTGAGATEAAPSEPMQRLQPDSTVAQVGTWSLSFLSTVLLVVGLALFVIRWGARRLGRR
jgi:anti-sigma factor RsiW